MKHKSMTISYEEGNILYLNITNACQCHCIFCVRKNGDNVFDSDPLWLEHTPTFEEIKVDLEKRNIASYDEIVFCGFGEPTCRLDMIIKVCDWLHTIKNCPKIRLNTNGLAQLMQKNEESVPKTLKGRIDAVSVSLNAPNAEVYGRLTVPDYDAQTAFKACQDFILECKKYIPEVKTTAVSILSDEEAKQTGELAKKLGVPFRVRKWDH